MSSHTITRPPAPPAAAGAGPRALPGQDIQPLWLPAVEMARLVQRLGLERCLRGLMARIRHDFCRWSEFDKVPRSAHHSALGVIELMPVGDARRYAFKYVNGHPGNQRLGLPTVLAFGVLADVQSGLPRVIADMTLLTALRTAATSALAARALMRADSRVHAIIGNGAQAAFQALALSRLAGLHELRLYDIDPLASTKLAIHLSAMGLRARICASTEEALADADVVTTATADKSHAKILSVDMVRAGMHLNAIGGDCPGKTELQAEILHQAQVFVEFEAQTRIEGELQQMPADFAATELWQVLTGAHPGRPDAKAITVFDSVGFALEDHAALRHVGRAAQMLGIGHRLEMFPRQSDPRDLLGWMLDALQCDASSLLEAAPSQSPSAKHASTDKSPRLSHDGPTPASGRDGVSRTRDEPSSLPHLSPLQP